jgi:hypothetical protein
MAYKWKPNASQRKAFAQKMQDPEERASYQERKAYKNSYEGFKDRDFIPTEHQYDFAMITLQCGKEMTNEQEDACRQVVYGYGCKEKIPHSLIHIVQEMRRDEACASIR